jgi:hypothetical protein
VVAFRLLAVLFLAAMTQNGCITLNPKCPLVVSPEFSARYQWPPEHPEEALVVFGCKLAEANSIRFNP